MQPLDPVTLATYSAGVGSILGLLSFVYWRTRHTYPGFGNWVGSVVLFAMAMASLTLRDLLSPTGFALIPALCLLGAMALANRGARRFFGEPGSDPWVLAILVGSALALGWAAQEAHHVMAVHMIGAFGAALIALRAAWSFFGLAPAPLRMAALMCATILAMFAVQRLMRIDFYFTAVVAADLQRAVPASAFNYVINALVTTFWAFGFLYLNTTRVELELEASREELRALALMDPLTGVANRRALYDHASRELTRAARNHQPVTMLMVDIDHFKRVNDSHGHLVGDQLLRQTAAAITATLRASDVVARYGGEEFAVLLIDAKPATARESAERLRLAIAAVEVLAPAGPVRVTASIGLAATSGDEQSVEELLRRADAALYLAKQGGRDRVVAA